MKFGTVFITFFIVVAFLLAPSQPNATKGQTAHALESTGRENSHALIDILSMKIEKNPLDHYAYNKRGIIWLYMGNQAKAISDFTRAITANLKFSEAYANRGVVWYLKGNYAKAISDFTAAIQIEPDHYKAHAYRGDAWYKQKLPDNAISDYQAALRIFPQYARAYNSRGFVWSKKGEYERALADYNRALEINPNFWTACCNLAWLLSTCADDRYRHGDRAVILAEKAVDIKANRISLECLAAAYAETANFDKAVSIQKNAIRSITEMGETGSLSQSNQRLRSYEAGRPWRGPFVIAPLKKEQAGTVPSASPTQLIESENKRNPVRQEPIFKERDYPYTIQVSSYPQNDTSFAKARQLQLRGDVAFTSYAHIAGKGDWYRVFIGYYPSVAEAQKAAEVLKRRKFRYTQVVKMPYAVQIGCYASIEVIDAVEANLLSIKYVPYRVPGTKGTCKTRLMIGAFETAQKAGIVVERLKNEGFEAMAAQR